MSFQDAFDMIIIMIIVIVYSLLRKKRFHLI